MQHENKFMEFSDSIKCSNIHITGVLEEEKMEAENLCQEIIAENFTNLRKETDL